MKKYLTGFHAGKAVKKKERELPQIDIAGTLFLADTEKLEFRQATNPDNLMPMLGAKEEMGFSHFFYDTHTKNLYAGPTDIPTCIPSHVRIILLPPLKDIDPIGLARKHGLPDDFYSGKISTHRKLTAFSKESKTEGMLVKRKSQRL